jgi:hypothetical protein
MGRPPGTTCLEIRQTPRATWCCGPARPAPVLLVRLRTNHPGMGGWCLTGRFMKPETRARLARITIPVAVVIAVLGAIDGKWPVVVAMALAVALQIMSYRSDRGNRG